MKNRKEKTELEDIIARHILVGSLRHRTQNSVNKIRVVVFRYSYYTLRGPVLSLSFIAIAVKVVGG